jgi:hypothetical protein
VARCSIVKSWAKVIGSRENRRPEPRRGMTSHASRATRRACGHACVSFSASPSTSGRESKRGRTSQGSTSESSDPLPLGAEYLRKVTFILFHVYEIKLTLSLKPVVKVVSLSTTSLEVNIVGSIPNFFLGRPVPDSTRARFLRGCGFFVSGSFRHFPLPPRWLVGKIGKIPHLARHQIYGNLARFNPSNMSGVGTPRPGGGRQHGPCRIPTSCVKTFVRTASPMAWSG